MMAAIIAPRYAKAIASRYATSAQSGFPIGRMKTVEEVRRERLGQLRKEAGSLVALNAKLGLSARDATLSQILNSAKNSRTGTPKQMGSKLARELEAACDKEVGWMDSDPALVEAVPALSPALREIAEAFSGFSEDQIAYVMELTRMAIRQAPRVGASGSREKVTINESSSSVRRKM